jgi:hypothetical protein
VTATPYALLTLKKRVRNEFNYKNHAHPSEFDIVEEIGKNPEENAKSRKNFFSEAAYAKFVKIIYFVGKRKWIL